MAERLVRRRLQQIDAVPHQLVGAAIDIVNGNLERELQRRASRRRRRILRRPARPRQCERVAADLISIQFADSSRVREKRRTPS